LEALVYGTYRWQVIDPDIPSDLPAVADWWALRSACTPAGCTATGTLLGRDHRTASPAGDRAVFHWTGDRWQGEYQFDYACIARGFTHVRMSEAVSLTPQPDGTCRVTKTDTTSTPACSDAANTITFVASPYGPTPPGVVADPPPS
jgi:serine/threonine-protein kinase